MLAWVKYCVFRIALSCSSSKLALLEFDFSHKPICFPFPNSCTQLCPTLCAPCTVARQALLSMGILQSRILAWVTMPSSRGSSQPRDWTQVSHIVGRFFTDWGTREALEDCISYHNPNLVLKPNHFPFKTLDAYFNFPISVRGITPML